MIKLEKKNIKEDIRTYKGALRVILANIFALGVFAGFLGLQKLAVFFLALDFVDEITLIRKSKTKDNMDDLKAM